ncbi:Gfo/Idh/MocA family oxidoreductase [Kiritimatiellaeota bacterium B1221]|nr:Gfo/Idh/MocA family oxidoreductase [Kiritimatiellaeota bacterium B1221]
MKEMIPIKFGVCGVGRIGAQHCRHFVSEGNDYAYELVALCDADPERLQDMAEKFGGKPCADFGEFLADPQMEVVIIATRSLDHAVNAEQALAAGKIVLLEKPIGVTAADYQLLQRLDRDYPGKLFFMHNLRFQPAFMNLQEILASGVLGDLRVAKLCKHHDFMRRNDWQMRLDCGGGQLSVWGPHLIDQGLQLLGAPVREVWSDLQSILTPGDADDQVKMILSGTNGRVIELEISNSVALPGPSYTIHGDRGSLTCDQDQKTFHLKYLDPTFRWPEARADAGSPVSKGYLGADPELPWIEETRKVTPETSPWDQVEIEIATHLYNSLRNAVPFPIKNADALEVVRITEVVKKQNLKFQWIG